MQALIAVELSNQTIILQYVPGMHLPSVHSNSVGEHEVDEAAAGVAGGADVVVVVVFGFLAEEVESGKPVSKGESVRWLSEC